MTTKKVSVIKASRSVKTVIRTAMKAVRKRGIKITSGSWGIDMDEKKGYFVPSKPDAGEKKQVCALGALLVMKNGSIKFDEFRGKKPLDEVDEVDTALYVLGVNRVWVGSFISGFDGDSPEFVDQLIWDRQLRKYAPTKDEQVLEYRRAYQIGKDLAIEFGLISED